MKSANSLVFGLTIILWAINSSLGQEDGQARAKSKSRKRDVSAEFFSAPAVPRLRIEIGDAHLAGLAKDDRDYVPCTIREGTSVYSDVGVHLKGGPGSFRGLDDRPSLTLNFDKFVADQKFHGMDKLHLNNAVQDATYMMEIICGELFRAAGVPAPRGAHARVELNGRDLGLYVLKEGFDKTFLKRHFANNRGNLYEPGYRKDITEPMEKRTGANDVPDQADLKALAEAVTEPDLGKRLKALQKVLDLERFLSFVAMEAIIAHWDGYAVSKNNYRVYHDPDTDKLVFFPQGMDQFFDSNASLQPAMQGSVAVALLQTVEGQRQYRQRVGELFTNFFDLQLLTNRVNELHARIRPVLAAINPGAAEEHDREVIRLRDAIVERAASIQRQLDNKPDARPLPLKFDASGAALVAGWEPQNDSRTATLDQIEQSGRLTLHIRANGFCVSSWRVKVLLDPGRYRLEGRTRTAGVVAFREEENGGAGFRISNSQGPPANYVRGNTDWKQLNHEFSVSESQQEVLLVAELRANEGDVWFDADSLRLVRLR